MDEIIKLKNSIRNMKILIIILVGIVVFSFVMNFMLIQQTILPVEENNQPRSLKTHYAVQNLEGNLLETFYAWQPRDKLEIYIVDENQFTKEKINSIKKAMISTDVIEIPNDLAFGGEEGTYSYYWIGWKGAIDYLREQKGIEKPLEIIFTDKETADVTITLINSKSGEAYSGVTNSLVNDEEKTILSSDVIIYEADQLSNEELEILVRHEFGHVAGLAHSTSPEDLMYPIIQTPVPWVSLCDAKALLHLYTGGKTSQVICET
jgi:hypothetical protein